LWKDHIVESRDFDLRSSTSTEPSTVTTKLFPAVDTMLAWLRLDLNPRAGVRLAVGGLREIPSDGLDPRKRLIEGEVIIENRERLPARLLARRLPPLRRPLPDTDRRE
jgi:hypothetical protein